MREEYRDRINYRYYCAVINIVSGQGILSSNISTVKMAHIRPSEAQQALEVPFDSKVEMTKAFEAAHAQRFGFVPQGADLIIEILSAEAIGQTGETVTLEQDARGQTHAENIQMWSDGTQHSAPVVDRTKMRKGDLVVGPAILTEPTGTNILECGWQAECIADGCLVLTRTTALVRQEAIGTKVDPVMLEVFNNLFMSIADQMGATLANTAYSVNIKERYDFSCAIFDENGDLVANAPHVPVHLGSMSESVRVILA
jgi:5-oxoprolinase (ATP-hydrolysing)